MASGDWLDALEELRLESPEHAAAAAKAEIKRLGNDPGDYARLCGIYGSSLRSMARLEEAGKAIQEGLRYADLAGDLLIRADLLKRYGFVFAEDAKFKAAFFCVDEAIGIYLMFGRSTGVGKALVDKAGWYFHLGDYALAIACNEKGLVLLSSEEKTYRLTGFLGLAYCHRASGDLDKTKELIGRAIEEVKKPPRLLMLSFKWLEAEIACEENKLDKATKLFADLVDEYRECQMFLDAASAAIELVRTLLALGRGKDATRFAASLIWLIAPLKNNRIAYAEVLELVRSGQSGDRLTASQVRHLRKRLRIAKEDRRR